MTSDRTLAEVVERLAAEWEAQYSAPIDQGPGFKARPFYGYFAKELRSVLAAHSAVDAPETLIPISCGVCGRSIPNPGTEVHPCFALVGSNADTETRGKRRRVCSCWRLNPDGSHESRCALAAAPVPSAERPDAGTDEGLAKVATDCCGRLMPEPLTVTGDVHLPEMCPACSWIGTGEESPVPHDSHVTCLPWVYCPGADWTYPGPAAYAAEMASDWLVQRDHRIAEAARAEGARSALLSAAEAVDAMSLLDGDPDDQVLVHVGAKWLRDRAAVLPSDFSSSKSEGPTDSQDRIGAPTPGGEGDG